MCSTYFIDPLTLTSFVSREDTIYPLSSASEEENRRPMGARFFDYEDDPDNDDINSRSAQRHIQRNYRKDRERSSHLQEEGYFLVSKRNRNVYEDATKKETEYLQKIVEIILENNRNKNKEKDNVLCKIEILNLISIVHGNKGYDNSKNVKDKNMDNHSITLEKFLYPDVVV